MSKKQIILPINEHIRNKPNFFNEPSLIQCFHCDGYCNKTAPIPLPISRDNKTYKVHNGKFACDIYCAAVLTKDLPLLINMLLDVYEIETMEELIAAPDIFALKDYGGPLSREEFEKWKVTSHTSEERDEIILANPFYSYVFDPESSLWKNNNGNTHVPFKCMHCRNLIGNRPIRPGIEHYDKEHNKFILKGIYCHLSCAFRAMGVRGGNKSDLRIHWFAEFVRRHLGHGRQVEIKRPPSRRLLINYYGPLTPEQYHMENPFFLLVLQPPFVDYPFTAIRDMSTGFDMVDLNNRQYKLGYDFVTYQQVLKKQRKEKEKEEKKNNYNHRTNSFNFQEEEKEERKEKEKEKEEEEVDYIQVIEEEEEDSDYDDEEDYYLMSQRKHAIYHKVTTKNTKNGNENPFRLQVVLLAASIDTENYSTQDFLKQIVKQA